MSYTYDAAYSPRQQQQQQQVNSSNPNDSHVGINMGSNNNNNQNLNHSSEYNSSRHSSQLSTTPSTSTSIQTRFSPSASTSSNPNPNPPSSSSTFSSLSYDQHSQQSDNYKQNQNRLSAYVSPRLLHADPHLREKEFSNRDRERELGHGLSTTGSSSNLGRSLSLGDRHGGGGGASVGTLSGGNAGYQPHSSSNLSHSTSNASSHSHHRLLASPSLAGNGGGYNSSHYYNSSASVGSSTRTSELPLPASASSSSTYSLLPIVNTQSQSQSQAYLPNSPSSNSKHHSSTLGMDPHLQSNPTSSNPIYSPRSPASASSRQQSSNQQRPHSYYDPSYGSSSIGTSGTPGLSGHRQSLGPGFNETGGLSSPSQWKPNSNSRHASPSNGNVNINVGMVDETSIGIGTGSSNRLSQRASRRDLKANSNQDLGGLPTHNNHGIYDLLPTTTTNTNQTSTSNDMNDSLPYAYSSRDLNNGNPIFSSSSPSTSQTHPPPPPQSSNSQRNSTLGIHSSNQLYQSQNNYQQATSPTSSSSTIHGNNTYDPNPNNQSSNSSSIYQINPDPNKNSDLNRSSSLRNSNVAHRVERNLREPAREVEFRRVRDSNDLRPSLEAAASGKGRRADPMGGYVSPLKALTAYLHHTYHLVNPAFFYELSFNPRRVLTKPSRPCHNDGHDNEDSDYILYVNDWLGAEEGNRYLILDVLGQGTFGQVVKCQNMKTHEIVAVKVIKNKPAYFNQSMMEVTILEMLNGTWDPNDKHHILRLRDTFIHAKHLCLVFELLSSNLYELIKQNSFRGLSTSLVRVFTAQLLDALTVLNEARLIHCDLKPENILLKTLQDPSIKLVDFGSACHERQTVYTYIQSRFYRSPEVLLGLPYSSAIDMWSLGCIAVELFLGLPLFPGTSEYNQVCRIVEMLGLPPSHMMEQGKQTNDFFHCFVDHTGRKSWRLKSLETYSKEHNVEETPSKKYFTATKFPDIVKGYSLGKKAGKPAEVQKEMANRASFIDFVEGLLNMNPAERWTPQQAKLHPFITTERFVRPFVPPPVSGDAPTTSRRGASGSDSTKHPYGGLPQTQQRSSRAYHDAAAYNQHLAQQQTYNSVATARQSQPPPINNPYVQESTAAASSSLSAAAAGVASTSAPASQGYTTRNRANTMTRMENAPPSLSKIGIDSSFGLSNPSNSNSSGGAGVASSSLTPASNREEWERRQGSGGSTNSNPALATSSSSGTKQRPLTHGYQGMELLQGQSELPTSNSASAGWAPTNWSSPSSNSVKPNQGSPSMYALPSSRNSNHMNQAPQQNPGAFSVVVDRQVHPQDQHHQQQQQQRSSLISSPSGMGAGIAAPPPAAYTSNSSSSTNRYDPGMRPSSGTGGGASMGLTLSNSGTLGSGLGGAFSNALPIDSYDSGISQLMPALKPTQYSDPSSMSLSQRHSVLMSPNSSGIDPRSYSSPSNNNNNNYSSGNISTSHAQAHAQAHARAQAQITSNSNSSSIPLGLNPGNSSNHSSSRAGTLGPEDAFGLQDWNNPNQRRPPSAGNHSSSRGY